MAMPRNGRHHNGFGWMLIRMPVSIMATEAVESDCGISRAGGVAVIVWAIADEM